MTAPKMKVKRILGGDVRKSRKRYHGRRGAVVCTLPEAVIPNSVWGVGGTLKGHARELLQGDTPSMPSMPCHDPMIAFSAGTS